jgi:hypothetical protein
MDEDRNLEAFIWIQSAGDAGSRERNAFAPKKRDIALAFRHGTN